MSPGTAGSALTMHTRTPRRRPWPVASRTSSILAGGWPTAFLALVDLDTLPIPIVQAPMAGGPSTPELAIAVCQAGGLGFLAAGYRPPGAVVEEIAALRGATDRPFGVNLFVPPSRSGDPDAVTAYAARMAAEADRYGVDPGEPRYDEDGWEEKLALVGAARVAVVSFTFGCPAARTLDRVRLGRVGLGHGHRRGGGEDGRGGGGRRPRCAGRGGGWAPGLVRGRRWRRAHRPARPAAPRRPRHRSAPCRVGGIADGAGVAAVLCAGAAAAQLGTALMRTPEAATSPVHRRALAEPGTTELTRAFSGRRARGLANRFQREHAAVAPRAYPEVHHLTAPLRAAARAAGDADGINLWAGQAHALAEEAPAAELVARWGAEARDVVGRVGVRLSAGS